MADLLTDTAYLYEGGPTQGQATAGPSPTTWPTASTRSTTTWSRASSSPTTTCMERYLEGETISPKELEDTLALGVGQASVFPVVCGSATKLVGIDRLAEFICEIGPSPRDRPPVDGAGRRRRRPRSRATPTASRWPSCSRRSPTPTSAR